MICPFNPSGESSHRQCLWQRRHNVGVKKNKESTNVHGCPQEALACWAGHYLQSHEKAFPELLLPLQPRLRGLEPADRNAPFLGQEHTEGRLWSEELIFVETFALSYKTVRCVAGLSLTLEQRTKSILVSHTEENTEDAETTGALITFPRPLPIGRTTCLPFISSSGDFLEHFSSKSGCFLP